MAKYPPPIPQEQALDLIQRLLAGSRTASSELADAYMDWLAGRIRAISSIRFADEHACISAASDALVSLIKRPDQYDRERGPLAEYLVRAAGGDLRNAMRSERRHHVQQRRGTEEPHLRVVELSGFEQEQAVGEFDDPAKVLERRETVREALALVRPPVPPDVQEKLTPVEERVLALMRDRVRRTAEFAAAMGIGDLPPDEQRKQVKKMKDRLTKRLERARSRHDSA